MGFCSDTVLGVPWILQVVIETNPIELAEWPDAANVDANVVYVAIGV